MNTNGLLLYWLHSTLYSKYYTVCTWYSKPYTVYVTHTVEDTARCLWPTRILFQRISKRKSNCVLFIFIRYNSCRLEQISCGLLKHWKKRKEAKLLGLFSLPECFIWCSREGGWSVRCDMRPPGGDGNIELQKDSQITGHLHFFLTINLSISVIY